MNSRLPSTIWVGLTQSVECAYIYIHINIYISVFLSLALYVSLYPLCLYLYLFTSIYHLCLYLSLCLWRSLTTSWDWPDLSHVPALMHYFLCRNTTRWLALAFCVHTWALGHVRSIQRTMVLQMVGGKGCQPQIRVSQGVK